MNCLRGNRCQTISIVFFYDIQKRDNQMQYRARNQIAIRGMKFETGVECGPCSLTEGNKLIVSVLNVMWL